MLPYVLIPKLGAPLCIDSQAGSLWEPLCYPLCIDSQAGSLWEPLGASGEPLYVLIPKLGASGSLWEPLGASGSLWEPPGASGSLGAQNGQNNLLFGIPIRRGRMGCRNGQISKIYIWEPLGAPLCIDSQAGSLWEPLCYPLCIDSQAGSLWGLWEPLGNHFMY
jgi:hypothetical protein